VRVRQTLEPNDTGNLRQAGALRCAPPALARNQLKNASDRSHNQGLDDAAGLNGARQFIESSSRKRVRGW